MAARQHAINALPLQAIVDGLIVDDRCEGIRMRNRRLIQTEQNESGTENARSQLGIMLKPAKTKLIHRNTEKVMSASPEIAIVNSVS
jgi:hypothetical protein